MASSHLTGRRPVLTRDVAPGIHRLAHAYVNCYIVEDGDSVTIVDAAFPSTWRHLVRALEALGRAPDDIAALVLTHAHFDHLGFARRLTEEWNVPVLVHSEDRYIAAHPYRYAHERARAVYPLLYSRALPVLLSMTAAGALQVHGVSRVRDLPSAGTADVPGSPTVIFSPGHTFGHCALHFPDRDALITGDALVTLDPYKGVRGPQIIAGAATADSAQALRSLDALSQTGARVLLPGHGEPWRSGAEAAVAAARSAGAS
jgi:glyoxylase-like metal-dependent hydrolase (beta-lactamase superfamily II)